MSLHRVSPAHLKSDSIAMAEDSWPYPWQASQWSLVNRAAVAGRLHHATLLSGPAGIGKLEFAQAFARALLCSELTTGVQAPCGRCNRCALTAGGTHPDIMMIDWLEKASVIGVEQIRKLAEKLSLTATYGPYRVAIINRADTLTNAAANGLLKTLEEPGPGCAIFLLANREAKLPATIRSRCQRVVMPLPDRESSLAWLQQHQVADAEIALEFAQGAPVLAQAYSQDGAGGLDLAEISAIRGHWSDFLQREGDPGALAAKTAGKLSTAESLTLFMQWTTDLVKNLELSIADGRLNSERSNVERRYLSQTLETLQQGLRLDNASLKTQTVLEGLLADIRIYRLRIRAENTQ